MQARRVKDLNFKLVLVVCGYLQLTHIISPYLCALSLTIDIEMQCRHESIQYDNSTFLQSKA